MAAEQFDPSLASIYKPSSCTIGMSDSNLAQLVDGGVSNEELI